MNKPYLHAYPANAAKTQQVSKPVKKKGCGCGSKKR